MTRQRIAEVVQQSLSAIAPEADLAALPRDGDLRDELDLDSMDVLRYATALHQALAVDIPEADYPKLLTLASCEDYLVGRLGSDG